MVKTFLGYIVHNLGFFVNGYGLYYDVMYNSIAGEGILEYWGFPGKFKYLTFWNQILQTLYFGFSVINDLVGTNHCPTSPAKRSSLQRFRDFSHAAIVFPISSFVVLTFWSLYAINRDLVFPNELNSSIPPWLNHVMHTTVIIFLILEKFCVHHRYPRRQTGILFAVGFGLIYQIWVLWIALTVDNWVYPILEILSWPSRIVFFLGCYVLILVLYVIGEQVTRTVWRLEKIRKLLPLRRD